MSPKCASSRASELTAAPKCSSTSRASSTPGEVGSLGQQRRGEHRVLGQRRDDDRRFTGSLDVRRGHAPARQRGGMRVNRSLEFGRTGMEVVHGIDSGRASDVRRHAFAAMIRAVFSNGRSI